MSLDHNYPQLAIDHHVFSRALDGGALDTCLDYLRRQEIAGTDTAHLACRLGEKLYHDGRADDAVECGRAAFAAAANDNDVAHFCAWLFSNCGRHAEAARAYEQLLAQRPDWIEGYRHASGVLSAIGAADKALDFAIKASELSPDRFDFAYHAGCLLLDAARFEDAVLHLRRAAAIEPSSPYALRALSAALHALGQRGEALTLAVQAGEFALQAADLAPLDTNLVIHAGELLLRAGRADEAAAMIGKALTYDAAEPLLWRLAAEAHGLRDAPDDALAAIEQALRLAPDDADYHLHRGHLLFRRGDFTAAAEAVNRAAALDPASQAAQRARLDLLLANGKLLEATTAGGELLRAFPADQASAEAVLRVLNRRLDTIDGDYVVLADRHHRVPRPPRRPPSLAERCRAQARVVHALIIRETRTRFGDSRLGYGWALLEPILHITLLWAMFALLMHGTPPIGTHFFLFYFTGLVPFHVFVHASTGMMHAVTGNGSLLQLPPVKPFDVILARGLLEFATDLVVASLLLAGFAAAGIPALPDDVWSAAMALSVVALLGCGVGYLNAVLQTLFRSWDKLWNNATRLLYFFSGIFYIPGMMPDWARDIVVWNPLLQAIDWFRASFFASYQPHWLDRRFLVTAAVLSILAGLALERGLRRHLAEPA
ncbi:MAG TPA: ABC transporter permease [Stellaceae bacterium]|nr:ABC transporter permease [Stellaceae bacterium]